VCTGCPTLVHGDYESEGWLPMPIDAVYLNSPKKTIVLAKHSKIKE